MWEGLQISGSGLTSDGRQLDVIANNLANSSTPGFQAERADFESVLIAQGPVAGPSFPGAPAVSAAGATVQTYLSVEPGPVVPTGEALDASAPDGAYFVVQGPAGEHLYTRDGAFQLDANGHLVTADGNPVLGATGPLQIPAGSTGASLAADGTLEAQVGSAKAAVGSLLLATFTSPEGLQAVGGNLYAGSVAAGKVTEASAQAIRPGALTQSNVDMAREMTGLLLAERSYQLSANNLGTFDRMLQVTDQLAG